MKTAIIGGTFNPLHIGHLYLAEELKCQFSYEKIFFVPAHIPAHKDFDGRVTPEQRIDMLQAALKKPALKKGGIDKGQEDSKFDIETCEIERGGVSYTIDTIQHIKNRYNVTENVGMIVGDDLVEGLPSWKRWSELEKEIDLIIAHRTEADRLPYPNKHFYLNNLVLPVSSSSIRCRIKEGRAFRYLVPEPVYAYIIKNNLYR